MPFGPSAQGDVSDAIQRRYFTDDRGGPGRGFYVDASVARPAFRDRGDQLASDRGDPNAIRDMAEIARHRGWLIVTARGSTEFRREAWLAGRQAGLEVGGYQPTERDLQELERRRERRERGEQRRELQQEGRDDRRQRAGGTRDAVRSNREDRRAPPRCGLSKVWSGRVCRVRTAKSRSWIERGSG
jgi:hypothetical protein